jgi:menaquinone-9 beta-reductase
MNETTTDRTGPYDVVVVGASVAGCTAATLYGRAGLRVALLEKHRSAETAKRLCGHFILGCAQETLRRLDLEEKMLAAGGATGTFAVWSEAGWAESSESVPAAINLRRTKLDPMLRALAAGTPGVDLYLGHAADGLLRTGSTVVGVRARTAGGDTRELRGRLVVGADGYRSKTAELAGARARTATNGRFGFWAYYRGVEHRGGAGQLWLLDPDVAILTATDEGLVQLIAFPTKARLAEFGQDRAGALERFIRALPDAPDLARAERVSQVIGTTDYPLVRRDPTPVPGVALIGDAATTSDPTNAVGCGWAFQSAAMLVDATAPALVDGHPLSRGLRAYRRRHRVIERHDGLARADAKGAPANPVQRALRTAAVHDADIRDRFFRFAARSEPVSHLLAPTVVLRALRISRKMGRSLPDAVRPTPVVP